ncbi:MAG: hypothetical protein J2P30_00570 [Actinobacteria bacterium]|nr:hypothetical protein [Actinomycetota bacterium]
MSDYILSLIRTATPLAVGALLAWLSARGLNLDPSVADGLIPVLTGLEAAGYYALIRAAESRFPWVGVLLGHTAKPSYGKRAAKPAPVKHAA